MGFPGVPPGAADFAPEKPMCSECSGHKATISSLRIELSSTRLELSQLKSVDEIGRARMAEMERDLMAASGATVAGRDAETVKKLQRNDLTQRKDLDLCYLEVSKLRQEIDRLQKICATHKVSTARPATPDVSPVEPSIGWGAFTGGVGIQPTQS